MGSKAKRVLNTMAHYDFAFQAWADTAHAYPLRMAIYKKALAEISNDWDTINEYNFMDDGGEKELVEREGDRNNPQIWRSLR